MIVWHSILATSGRKSRVQTSLYIYFPDLLTPKETVICLPTGMFVTSRVDMGPHMIECSIEHDIHCISTF